MVSHSLLQAGHCMMVLSMFTSDAGKQQFAGLNVATSQASVSAETTVSNVGAKVPASKLELQHQTWSVPQVYVDEMGQQHTGSAAYALSKGIKKGKAPSKKGGKKKSKSKGRKFWPKR